MFGFFGPRLTSVFKSRWMALLWAVGIIWTAVSFVGEDRSSGPADNSQNAQNAALGTDVTGAPITGQDIAALKHAVEGP